MNAFLEFYNKGGSRSKKDQKKTIRYLQQYKCLYECQESTHKALKIEYFQ